MTCFRLTLLSGRGVGCGFLLECALLKIVGDVGDRVFLLGAAIDLRLFGLGGLVIDGVGLGFKSVNFFLCFLDVL